MKRGGVRRSWAKRAAKIILFGDADFIVWPVGWCRYVLPNGEEISFNRLAREIRKGERSSVTGARL